jgi:hypothetical protein
MLIEINEVQVGDEILISCQSCFKYLKVIRVPKITTKVHWNGSLRWSNAYCSTRRDEIPQKDANGNTRTYSTGKPIIRLEWVCTAEDHNLNQYVDLSYRQLWLVKRDGKPVIK